MTNNATELSRWFAQIDDVKLELLAEELDMLDEPGDATEAQDDLRKWAAMVRKIRSSIERRAFRQHLEDMTGGEIADLLRRKGVIVDCPAN